MKNRPNKNQHPRIILFVGSPISDTLAALKKLGKQLKKNSIAVDVINFGSENTSNGNTEKLETFIGAANSSDNSHLVNIPAGPHVMSNMVLTSEIMVPGGGGGSATSAAAPVRVGGGSSVEEDSQRDFEMAMRMSLEDHRRSQEQAASSETKTETTTTDVKQTEDMDEGEDDEEESDEEDFDEEEYARALAMSMAPTPAKPVEAKETETAENKTEEDQDEDVDMGDLEDPDFIRSLLEGEAEEGDINDILNKLNEGEDEQA